VEVCTKFGADWSGGSRVKEGDRYIVTVCFVNIDEEKIFISKIKKSPYIGLKLSFSFYAWKRSICSNYAIISDGEISHCVCTICETNLRF